MLSDPWQAPFVPNRATSSVGYRPRSRHADTALFETGGDVRLKGEEHREAVQRSVRHDRSNLIRVENDPGRAPHVRDGISIFRIDAPHDLQEFRVDVVPVRYQRKIQRKPQAFGNLTPKCGEAFTVTRSKPECPAESVVSAKSFESGESCVVDLDAGFTLELLQDGTRKVFRPSVQVEDLVIPSLCSVDCLVHAANQQNATKAGPQRRSRKRRVRCAGATSGDLQRNSRKLPVESCQGAI